MSGNYARLTLRRSMEKPISRREKEQDGNIGYFSPIFEQSRSPFGATTPQIDANQQRACYGLISEAARAEQAKGSIVGLQADRHQDSIQAATLIWDFPTRIFHWTLVVLVVANFFTGEDEGVFFVIHAYVGYAVGLLVLFRVGWGVIGSPHARFGDFIKPWRETRDYVRQLLRLAPPRYIGHNPLGGWMIVLMLLTLTAVTLTGMAAAVADGAVIPFFTDLPRWLVKASEEVHEGAANFMMALAAIHVAGVLIDSLLTRENLIKAMITGNKTIRGPDPAGPASSPWRAAVLAALLIAGTAWMIDRTSFSNVGDDERGAYEKNDKDDD